MPKFDEEKQKVRLQELHKREAEELAKILSVKYGIQYLDLSTISVNTDALRIIPEQISKDVRTAAFEKNGKKLKVAVVSPQASETKEMLKKLEKDGYQITAFMVSLRSIERLWKRYAEISYSTNTTAGVIDISDKNIEEIINKVKNLDDTREIIQVILNSKDSYRVSRFFESVLAGAFSLNVSDIHIEPEEKYVAIRFRLDGILVKVLDFDVRTYRALLSRIKLISGLKLNIEKKPQDGRLSIKLGEKDIEIRVSVLPDAYGESIVLRILNPDTIAVTMEDLGIEPHLLEILTKEINRPNGMLLNTGPTGSGKTTTLYAFLKKIHTPEIKIITIENPIEYHLPGVVQTQVDIKKGYTFLEGLRSSLRQDPDVIMVGEIRDNKTAKIAVNSALTGHLVFSTLHTNDAAGTFYRLVDLGIKPEVISTAVNVIIAQRLIRKPCKHCVQKVEATPGEKQIIDSAINEIENIEKYTDNTTQVYRTEGCDKCNGTGYRGRIGIFEAILVNTEVAKIFERNPDEKEINDIFRQQNILTLKQDGIIKILKGLTTISELRRVVDLE
ncbi:MAG: GspE/PulE family protein [Patescibacteria group bacterium]|nr:GspE/PulE family protein [Patescibacteria group bacterium]